MTSRAATEQLNVVFFSYFPPLLTADGDVVPVDDGVEEHPAVPVGGGAGDAGLVAGVGRPGDADVVHAALVVLQKKMKKSTI